MKWKTWLPFPTNTQSQILLFFKTIRHSDSSISMDPINETFTVWTELEGWSRNNFLVQPAELNGEKIFKILTEHEMIDILHKTFESTWEAINGNLTLQDSERLGEEIENYFGA